jgi:hypothetical protein
VLRAARESGAGGAAAEQEAAASSAGALSLSKFLVTPQLYAAAESIAPWVAVPLAATGRLRTSPTPSPASTAVYLVRTCALHTAAAAAAASRFCALKHP